MFSDIDECESNPCENGSTCLDLANGFNCTCIAGYTGDTCTTGRPGPLCQSLICNTDEIEICIVETVNHVVVDQIKSGCMGFIYFEHYADATL